MKPEEETRIYTKLPHVAGVLGCIVQGDNGGAQTDLMYEGDAERAHLVTTATNTEK